jgi:hypothetical protein
VLKCVEAAVMTGAERVVRRHPEKVSLRPPRDLPGLTGRHGYTIVYRVQEAFKGYRRECSGRARPAENTRCRGRTASQQPTATPSDRRHLPGARNSAWKQRRALSSGLEDRQGEIGQR